MSHEDDHPEDRVRGGKKMREKISRLLKAHRIALAALRKIKRIRNKEDEEHEIASAALKRIKKLEES